MFNTNILETQELTTSKLLYISSIGTYKNGNVFKEKGFCGPYGQISWMGKKIAELQIRVT